MAVSFQANAGEWIRINQVGYLPDASKVAVYVSNDKEPHVIESFSVVDAATGKMVYVSKSEDVRNTGALGELKTTVRLDFSKVTVEGDYIILAGGAKSSKLRISTGAYDGAADFVLNYMRQQRCGWNPFMKDSCHVKDGYIRYHPTKEGQWIDVLRIVFSTRQPRPTPSIR